MHRTVRFVYILATCVLGGCAYPLNGDWKGIEQHIVINGEVSEKRAVPFEECFSDLNAESDEAEASTTCINRGFEMFVDSSSVIIFEATNDLTQGQQVVLSSTSYSGESHVLSDGDNFEIECVLNKEGSADQLYCDFTNTIGYLNDSKIVFQKQ